MCLWHDSKLHPIVRLHFRRAGKCVLAIHYQLYPNTEWYDLLGYRRRRRRWYSDTGKYAQPSRNTTAYSGTNRHRHWPPCQCTQNMCFNLAGDIFTQEETSLKLVDNFTYLGSSVSSAEKDIDTRRTKAWTAIDKLSIIRKSDLTDERKHRFFQAAVVSILLYGCTTWTLTKRLEKKLDGNFTRMLRAILNKSERQHPTKHQLYGHLPPIT